MIARKSDTLRAQEVLEAISETNERIKVLISPRTSFCMLMMCGRGR